MNPLLIFMGAKALITTYVVKKVWPKEATDESCTTEIPEGLHEYRRVGGTSFAKITDQVSGLELWRCRSTHYPEENFSKGSFSSMDEFIDYIQTKRVKESDGIL